MKNYFEIPAFPPSLRGISRRVRILKIMLHLATTEMCLCFHLDFPLLYFVFSRNFKIFFPVPYPILSYITLITAIRCQKMRFKSHRGEE